MNQKKIYVLLMRMPDVISHALSLWMRFHYTHVSIGLEDDRNTYYSFGYKGFRIESIERFNRSPKGPFPCALYEISVSEDTYHRIKETLDGYIRRKEQLRFTKRGVLLAMLQIPHKFENRYFCSQFVSEVLQHHQLLPQKKSPSQFLPCDFHKHPQLQLVFQGMLSAMPV